ncbi:MAG TPA: replication factor C large subunit [Nanoarchaeota archaeon]|nr:replication factor C large subunit [Nanoarchaeota archaeon]HIH34626.1 replication factor C large subunit [Nanoarchaeota archaeon]HIH51379.1 replication factor C large subunit [Nanoarchaeota archaeon]HIH66234.1 replication factor C large subunit [Nanoarchaeota archaeon]
MWTEKYRPKNLKELAGQELAYRRLEDFVKNFSKQDKLAALLYSSSGSGKNSLVYVLAKELGLEVLEFNASQLRDKEKIKGILAPATQQQSLFGKGKIIFVDEADAFTGIDRGGLATIMALCEKTKWPIVFAASDLWDKKLNDLRSRVASFQLAKLSYIDIAKILQRVCDGEKIPLSKEIIEALAVKSRGDARAAINDLQSIAFLQNFIEIDKKVIDSLGEREKEGSIFNSLSLIFKSRNARDAMDAFDSVNMPLDECILWLDENLPLEYSGKELAEAYDALSRADIFRRRIMRHQHWRFLAYVSVLSTAGVAAAKLSDKRSYVSYKRLSRLLKIWMAKQKNLTRREIAGKIARHTHCSKKQAYKDMPLLEIIFRNSGQEEIALVSKQLRLDEDEEKYLHGLRASVAPRPKA